MIVLGSKEQDLVRRKHGLQVVPPDSVEEIAEVSRRPPESRQVLAHRAQHRRIPQERTHVHVGDQRHGKSKSRLQTGKRGGECAAQRQASDTHGLGRLVEHHRKQRPRIENRLPHRFEAAHHIRSPETFPVVRRATGLAAAVIRRLHVHDLHAQQASHPTQKSQLLHDGLRLHVSVNIEQPWPALGTLRLDATRVDRVDAARALVVVLAEERLDGIVQGRKGQVLVVEPWQRPSLFRAHPREPMRRGKELLAGSALVGPYAIERVPGARS
ncbi:MAG: hypothetical protein AMS21_00305 [Gemmatimonas sp. SG8_38_2]|nr:MAG: hypothetical protein AMS21_00305 [Gemmatimonas sp. SG8_38_2]